jgi:hypothetical protein
MADDPGAERDSDEHPTGQQGEDAISTKSSLTWSPLPDGRRLE